MFGKHRDEKRIEYAVRYHREQHGKREPSGCLVNAVENINDNIYQTAYGGHDQTGAAIGVVAYIVKSEQRSLQSDQDRSQDGSINQTDPQASMKYFFDAFIVTASMENTDDRLSGREYAAPDRADKRQDGLDDGYEGKHSCPAGENGENDIIDHGPADGIQHIVSRGGKSPPQNIKSIGDILFIRRINPVFDGNLLVPH